jgi:hypothetical protein
MSTRTISSPGVEINEIDLSMIARGPVGTNVFITGFASQGPTEELVEIGSVSEYESVFGIPTNSAERYLYYSARQVLEQSNGKLTVCRLPYGAGPGEGYSNHYTALVFPVSGAVETEVNSYSDAGLITSKLVTYESASYAGANYYQILSPKLVTLSQEEYEAVAGGYTYWDVSYTNSNISNFEDIRKAGLVILNPVKYSVNNLFEGSYIAIADNSNNNPDTEFNGVLGMTVFNGDGAISVPQTRLNFSLSANKVGGSISEVIEKLPTAYDFGSKSYNDCLTIMNFKVKSSMYSSDTIKLDYRVVEGYTGSFNDNRTQNSTTGGLPVAFAVEKIINNNSSNINILINPNISKSSGWFGDSGEIVKKVRVSTSAKQLFSQGVFVDVGVTTPTGNVGNIPEKLSRVLTSLDDRDADLDIFPEAGLGTIWAGAQFCAGTDLESETFFFNETTPANSLDLADLKNQQLSEGWVSSSLRNEYMKVATLFETLAEKTRKDHIFIADPLRYIFINGSDLKTIKKKDFNFSGDIYWSLKNLYSGLVTSYGATYGNWIKYNDIHSNTPIWLPASGYVAADIADSTAKNFAWSAPAGFNRGQLSNVIDLAINPTQKQRDLLYRININPIAFFPGDGYVIFGQKTLFNKPSAFDRINVRRLFLYLEKTVKYLLKYYVFEPNTFATRTRLVEALLPTFNQAKLHDGVYDFKIICDERNNTPDVIDNNELKLSIYIQPVRTAEFILADFIATRTGINFNELTS